MSMLTNKRLLKNKKVIEEISRHQWIESERAGYDIGFEKASTQWLEGFSKAWMQYHMPKRKSLTSKLISGKKSSTRKVPKKRSSQAKTKARKS